MSILRPFFSPIKNPKPFWYQAATGHSLTAPTVFKCSCSLQEGAMPFSWRGTCVFADPSGCLSFFLNKSWEDKQGASQTQRENPKSSKLTEGSLKVCLNLLLTNEERLRDLGLFSLEKVLWRPRSTSQYPGSARGSWRGPLPGEV